MEQVRQALLAYFVLTLPLIGAIMFVPAILLVHCTPVRDDRLVLPILYCCGSIRCGRLTAPTDVCCAQWAWERKRTCALLSKSKARPFELPTAQVELAKRQSTTVLQEALDKAAPSV